MTPSQSPSTRKGKVGAKRKTAKARMMWARDNYYYEGGLTVTIDNRDGDYRPVFVLPADAESIEAMAEVMARAQCKLESRPSGERGYWGRHSHDLLNDARHNLAALGLSQPTQAGRKRKGAK